MAASTARRTLAPAAGRWRRAERLVRRAPLHLALWAIALAWLAPVVGLLITSLRPKSDILSTGWWAAVVQPRFTFDNYAEVLGSHGMLGALLNSLQITIPSTLIPLVVAAFAGYAFAWLRFPYRDTIFMVIVALMMVPVQLGFIPLLHLLGDAGLTQNFTGIWLVHSAYALPFGVFLLRNFFVGLPSSIIEAARLDGAGEFRIFRTLVVPLSTPAIASYGIFQFLWVWNDLLMALVYAQNPAASPMTRQIQGLLSEFGTEWHLLAAGAFVLMVVPLTVFFGLQRYFAHGLLSGSVK
ncbi:sugar ABC transporter permease [Couchioplanes caeruleus subsp. caeruleus]|uniref:Sugar ABC transporter permease n=1 Tax=Couchioplanes caeruleus subsp. caeruleus TaxID=56427 RepID=A0A1K0FZC8_9ACTN|nr:sugar ABC transporter permease [Couchioplanes caeruleus subsp. caeruleus]